VLETDASEASVGAVLMQDHNPIAFCQQGPGTQDERTVYVWKKYVAIFLAIEQWRPYIQLGEFYIFTGQKSLSHLTE
jgi:hypothetical protein